MTAATEKRRVFTSDMRGRAENRRFAFSPVIVTATDQAGAQLLVSAGQGEALLLSALVASNGGAGGAELSLAIADTGQTPNQGSLVISALAVGPNAISQIADGLMLNPGQSAYVFSSASLQVSGWVTAYL